MLTEIATRLDPEKYQVFVYSIQSRPDLERAHLVERLEQAGVTVRFLDANRKTQFFAARKKLKDYIEADQIDLVMSFLFHANILAASAIGKKNSIPLVWKPLPSSQSHR